MITKRYKFYSLMAHFFNHKYGPSWFTKDFFASNTDQDTKFLATWATFITPRLMVNHVNDLKAHIKILGYQPKLIAQKFGLIQLLPRSLYSQKSDFCLCTIPHTQRSCVKRLS